MDHDTARDIIAACEQATTALTAAEAAIGRMPGGAERTQHLRALAGVLAKLLGELRAPAVRQYPELDIAVAQGDPDTLLDASEQELVARLPQSALHLIDQILLAEAAPSWRKVARVVGTAMNTLHEQFPGVPDGFYGQRVAALVRGGKLEAQGNLDYMRFSEVRHARGGKGVA